jgi:hypothetical protein
MCMETIKKNKKVLPQSEDKQPSITPLKVFRIDDVSVSVFARDRQVQGEDVTFYSVSFSRSYQDANGVRQYTKSFDAEDLGKLVSLIQQCSEFIQSRQAVAA